MKLYYVALYSFCFLGVKTQIKLNI